MDTIQPAPGDVPSLSSIWSFATIERSRAVAIDCRLITRRNLDDGVLKYVHQGSCLPISSIDSPLMLRLTCSVLKKRDRLSWLSVSGSLCITFPGYLARTPLICWILHCQLDLPWILPFQIMDFLSSCSWSVSLAQRSQHWPDPGPGSYPLTCFDGALY
jgi:hypothetical protein